MIYLISDTHFGQQSIIPYCKRPFSSVEDMNNKLIENWNNTVTENDTVYFLGDLSFCKTEQTRDICNRLNGYKIIILGNHDRDKSSKYYREIGFNEVFENPTKLYYTDNNFNIRSVLLSHEPQYISNKDFNIHGHIHDSKIENEYPDMSPANHLCVCVERIDYRPISLKEIKEKYLNNFFNDRKED